MPVHAVVGSGWGDEGKGKFTDLLAAEADVVVRFQGGRNAGHTIVNGFGRFAFHLLPAGVFRPDVINLLGPGVALDVEALRSELDGLARHGVPEPDLRVSDRAQVVLPWHPLLDRLEERRLGAASWGSTQVGIAPCYADKALKLGIQVAELLDPERLRERVAAALPSKNALLVHLYGERPLELDALLPGLLDQGEWLRDRVCDAGALLFDALGRGLQVLLEGQLGTLRDPDHGAWPYVTSSSPLAGHGCVGAGVPPTAFERILAVAKAYATSVGASPLPTELHGPEADALRERGGEYGATTGRPRRVGWFDAVATRYGCRIQGATEAALSLLDVLSGREEIPICTAYAIDGRTTRDFPSAGALARARPVYERLPGWSEPLGAVRRFDALPAAARAYVERVEAEIDVPIRFVSVGPERDAVIRRDG